MKRHEIAGWRWGLDKSAVPQVYSYIQSPDGARLWLADTDDKQFELAQQLVNAANGCLEATPPPEMK